MTIHGLRIYPQSVRVIRDGGAPIYIHGRVAEDCTDFFYIFRPLLPAWRAHTFVQSFGVSYEETLTLNDPMPGLCEQYGPALIDADIGQQLARLRGDDFASWGAALRFCEGALIPIFRKPPPYDLLKRTFSDPGFDLDAENWPAGLRSILHMWDDIYWEIFTIEAGDVDLLIRAHAGDPKLKLFHAEIGREYVEPGRWPPRPVTGPGPP